MSRAMNESWDLGAFLDALRKETCADTFPRPAVTHEADISNEQMGLLGIALQTRRDGIQSRLELRETAGELRGG